LVSPGYETGVVRGRGSSETGEKGVGVRGSRQGDEGGARGNRQGDGVGETVNEGVFPCLVQT